MINPNSSRKIAFSLLLLLHHLTFNTIAQDNKVSIEIDFTKTLQTWKGIGVNYVETSQTPDYSWFPQDYGGFSILYEAQRREILEMIFGENGLKPGVTKMFLDPFHQESPDARFDHTSSTNWLRYFNRNALNNLGIITSHGFRGPFLEGVTTFRKARPDLHTWVTSTWWGRYGMTVNFLREIYDHLYISKINAFIPWAIIQTPSKWYGGDIHPECGFHVYDDGSYQVLKGYYLYKQVSPIGQPGMKVVQSNSSDTTAFSMAFASNGKAHPNAFVVINEDTQSKQMNIQIKGLEKEIIKAYMTDDYENNYQPVNNFQLKRATLIYVAPPFSNHFYYKLKQFSWH